MSVMPHDRPASGRPQPGGSRRPDASMSLLTTVMEHALDDGYAEATARRGETGRSRLPRTLRGKAVFALGLVLAAVVVTVGAAQTRSSAPREAQDRARLADRVRSETAAEDRRAHHVEALRGQVERAQRQALHGGSPGPSDRLRLLSADAAASGPGLRVTVDDASGHGTGGSDDPRDGGDFSDTGRVRDRDLQLVVNGLWEAGAEAVSVNGERLTGRSAIRAAGEAVLVDNRPLVPPYRLSAIGGGGRDGGFAARFRDSAGGLYLGELEKQYGIRGTVAPESRVAVPAAAGAPLRYAEPAAAPSAGPRNTRGPGNTRGAGQQ